jgi:signal recognition particle subunit SRP54
MESMFDTLTEKFTRAMKSLRGQARLNEQNIDAVLREVRVALLEADVHIQVVKSFLKHVKENAIGTEVPVGLDPVQKFIDIVYKELTTILGGEIPEQLLHFSSKSPTVIMMVGLQGSGKTTSCGKLAKYLKKNGSFPLLVPVDVSRPAAIEQLHVVAQDAGIPSFRTDSRDTLTICKLAMQEASIKGWDVVILDTAGRLHLDVDLMDELVQIKTVCKPTEILFVADSMTGHDAATSAGVFHEKLMISGVILTKVDGDTRGGAAFSIKHVTGMPIKFVGNGEMLDNFERFHPDRMAQRILGMGDVLTLIEQAKEKISEKEANTMAQRMAKNQFCLEDMRLQLQQVQKLGSMQKIIAMLPGVGQVKQQLNMAVTDKRVKHFEAILNSMTPKERKNHNILDGKRKRRIASGSGCPVHEVNQLLKSFVEMKKVMSQMGNPSFMKRMQGMQNLGSGPRFPF